MAPYIKLTFTYQTDINRRLYKLKGGIIGRQVSITSQSWRQWRQNIFNSLLVSKTTEIQSEKK